MRSALLFLVLAGCAGTGCMSMQGWWQKPKAAPAEAAVQPARSRPPVVADQITDSNAREMASALLDELDCDAQADTLASPDKPAGDTKVDKSKQH